MGIAIFIITRNASRNSSPDGLLPSSSNQPISASDSFSDGKERETLSGSGNQGGAIDNNGETEGEIPNSSQWIISKNGKITLKTPGSNALLQSGDEISGSAKSDTVGFMLIDDSIGLLAQGTLQVINDTFSGTLKFKPSGSTGRLDLFLESDSGAQSEKISIPVRF